jgi:hypothetical protein
VLGASAIILMVILIPPAGTIQSANLHSGIVAHREAEIIGRGEGEH